MPQFEFLKYPACEVAVLNNAAMVANFEHSGNQLKKIIIFPAD